ncbi:type I polyketide synthase [Mycobacterium kiyosense]|uniref:type I polyketide synthase n=1 Tax=Mycobacterium kiyosense TaxID=2871094 RepID=UPI002230356C|nr:type I polyketide synthase [Mycobacterium kiyosense]GLB91619.1 putative polyketide synthase [Mycobacterium kiyosense]GLC15161.1 putative polyketide synthase [Mycobacterium kiyosense]
MTAIAVVGIDCRFPGAPDKDAYWRLLTEATVTDTDVPAQRWDVETYYHPRGVAGSMNTRRGHFLDDVDAFDHEFFGITPVEAAVLDPQQRLLLQTSYRALEDAGIDPKLLSGTATGVFVGVMSSEWSSCQMLDLERISAFHGSGSGYFMLANRISYHLNLAGPSMAIDTACSSSLVAVHQGCAALRAAEVDTAIVAGTNLLLTPALSVFYTQAGLSASDGRCKPFCQGADGIGRGEGVGAVVLRRLDDAIAAGQQIYAVIRGSAVNHDGRSNGITAPNRSAQVALMRQALARAGVQAHHLAFVEAHGTGTVLGDMIEANALGDLHRSRVDGPCLLGSVKGNIGHTEGAAGIASFIKACLALHFRVLPPTVIAGQANPGLRLESQGLTLAATASDLPAQGALGGVSSFGLGGSNAHVVLESASATTATAGAPTGVLTLSAPNERGLRRNAAVFADAMAGVDSQHIAAWCRASNIVKRSHRHRLALAGDRDALLAGLAGYLAGDRDELGSAAPVRKGPAEIGLLCSGQGAQFPGMTLPLYRSHAGYRNQLDAVCAVLDHHLCAPLLPAIFGEHGNLDDTGTAQPALFAVSYALGKSLLLSGISPVFGIGHSVGEIALACLAGVFSVADAARMVVTRGALMGSLPPGGAMIAVDLPAAQAQALADAEPDCAVAAVNGPRSVVISGPAQSLDTIAAAVRRQGGRARKLVVSHAFHSPLMRPMVAEFRREIAGIRLSPAEFPIVSTVTGALVEGQEMDADYWARQICDPVRFADACEIATRSFRARYIAEAGPRATLLTLARQSGVTAGSLTPCNGPDSRGHELVEVAATLLRDGYPVELSHIYGHSAEPPGRIPPYEFDDGPRFWSDGQTTLVPERRATETPPPDSADVATDILSLIAAIGGLPLSTVTRSSRLGEDLGYDSLLQLRLFEQMRRNYPQLALQDSADLPADIATVGDLVDLVARRLELARTNP